MSLVPYKQAGPAIQQVPARFYPASQSLNKNADGLICSINMTQQDIQKSRIESRVEFYKNGKQHQGGQMAAQQGMMGG